MTDAEMEEFLKQIASEERIPMSGEIARVIVGTNLTEKQVKNKFREIYKAETGNIDDPFRPVSPPFS